MHALACKDVVQTKKALNSSRKTNHLVIYNNSCRGFSNLKNPNCDFNWILFKAAVPNYYLKENDVLFWKMIVFSLRQSSKAHYRVMHIFIRFRKYHSFHDTHIMCFCCIYLPHLNGRSLKPLSTFKPVCSMKKVGDCWFGGHSKLNQVSCCKWIFFL